ncbi:MAG: UDP-glucose--hexose-1-phosphate uridylyltransferase [Verrucomicrobiae bacterium]|nr:UDP-glucose--hexose-1-phosphate uridylyltransferase [Verrucomicrobiae bacterium]
MEFNFSDHPHRRYNPLTGEWILVSPHRTKRPWQGQQEKTAPDQRPAYDPKCYLCPGNKRADGTRNARYADTYVFTNDFSALLEDAPRPGESAHRLLRADGVQGTCRVICFSPRHDLTLPEMEAKDIRRVVDVWAGQVTELGGKHQWVQIFENKGAVMGCSNPHPHGQIWAGTSLPEQPSREDIQQRQYREHYDIPLLMDYLKLETARGERVVVENSEWLAVVPFWAVWPFEMLLMPRRHVLRLPDLSAGERDSLAEILKKLLTRYDNLFETSFPYSMGWHGAPNRDGDLSHWQLHAHFYPPLLRSATVRKFLVGYEMLAEAQRDVTAEQAAKRLRDLPEKHYKSAQAPRR